MGIKILGTGSTIPKKKIENSFFANYLDTNDEWIRKRTGIKTRFFFEDDKELTDSVVRAASLAISNLDIQRIKLVIVASMSSKNKMPIEAIRISKSLGLREDIFACDINVACTGFISALALGEGYLKKGEIGLIIGCESLSKMINYNDRSTAILFGDGVGAVAFEKTNTDLIKVFGQSHDDMVLFAHEDDGNLIHMEGQKVFRFATEKIIETIELLLKKANTDKDEIKHFIFHQANQRIFEYVAKTLKIPSSHIYQNIEHYGNTSSASIPILLDECFRKHMFSLGDKTILLGFGGGLAWGGILFEW